MHIIENRRQDPERSRYYSRHRNKRYHRSSRKHSHRYRSRSRRSRSRRSRSRSRRSRSRRSRSRCSRTRRSRSRRSRSRRSRSQAEIRLTQNDSLNHSKIPTPTSGSAFIPPLPNYVEVPSIADNHATLIIPNETIQPNAHATPSTSAHHTQPLINDNIPHMHSENVQAPFQRTNENNDQSSAEESLDISQNETGEKTENSSEPNELILMKRLSDFLVGFLVKEARDKVYILRTEPTDLRDAFFLLQRKDKKIAHIRVILAVYYYIHRTTLCPTYAGLDLKRFGELLGAAKTTLYKKYTPLLNQDRQPDFGLVTTYFDDAVETYKKQFDAIINYLTKALTTKEPDHTYVLSDTKAPTNKDKHPGNHSISFSYIPSFITSNSISFPYTPLMIFPLFQLADSLMLLDS